MDLNISTKYNIGDTVYIPDFYHSYWANPTPYIITDIFIQVARNHNITIRYRVMQAELTDLVFENFIFATYEECTKWCEKQN